ncbi:hypothetical protein C8R42DRAFT_649284 [Lentinula raphanica]|nr:hypothetical protein C8R42DRAFT_649284 [Lentinula raphanica]
MRFRARLLQLSLSFLRPFFVLFLVVVWISAIAVIASPTNRPPSGTEIFAVTLSQVRVQAFQPNGNAFGLVSTGAVHLTVYPGPEHLYKDGERVLTGSIFDQYYTFLGNVVFPEGKAKEYVQQARQYAQGFEYPDKDGTRNHWEYLNHGIGKLCEQSLFQDTQLKGNWEMNLREGMFLQPNHNIYLIEYVIQKGSSNKVPTGEVSVVVGDTNILHSRPVDHRTRFARLHTIGQIKSGLRELSLRVLYAFAAEHTVGGDAVVQEMKRVEEVWRYDYERPRPQRNAKVELLDLAQWKFAEDILKGLAANGYITETTLEKYRETRSERISVYISRIENRRKDQRDKALRKWVRKEPHKRGPQPFQREKLEWPSVEPA